MSRDLNHRQFSSNLVQIFIFEMDLTGSLDKRMRLYLLKLSGGLGSQGIIFENGILR